MGSSNCCTSRDPPSPDGDPPRPAVTLSEASHTTVKDMIPSWSTVSRISKPEDAAEFQAIFENIVDDQHFGDLELERIKNKHSSNTLHIIAHRLKKRLSRDSGISKRQLRASIGGSEEEVERRAELRRIRQKRIQEELSSEAVYDDDAKSLSTIAQSSGQTASLALRGAFPPMSLHLGVLVPHSSTLVNPESSHDRTSHSEHAFFRPRSIVSPGIIRPRRHSSPGPSRPGTGITIPLVYTSRKKLFLGEAPPAPITQAQSLRSIVATSRKSSWRLSFTQENRAEHLRQLSQDHPRSISTNSDLLLVDAKLKDRWLTSPALRASSLPISARHVEQLDSLESHVRTCTASHDFGGVDGVEDGSEIPRLHEMGIHRRLASPLLRSFCSSPELPSYRSRGSSIEQARLEQNERQKYMRSSTDSIPFSQIVPSSWGQVIYDDTLLPSALYAKRSERSAKNSSVYSPDPGTKSTESASPRARSIISTYSAAPISRMTTANDSSISLLFQRHQFNDSSSSLMFPRQYFNHQPTFEDTSHDTSLLASETSSFKHREAELQYIEARFEGAKKKASEPRASRFKEEFALSEASTPPRRSSPFHRLARLALGTFDGIEEEEEEGLLGVPAQRKGFGYKLSRSPAAVEPRYSAIGRSSTDPSSSGDDADAGIVDVGASNKRRLSAMERVSRFFTKSYDGLNEGDNNLTVASQSGAERLFGSFSGTSMKSSRKSENDQEGGKLLTLSSKKGKGYVPSMSQKLSDASQKIGNASQDRLGSVSQGITRRATRMLGSPSRGPAPPITIAPPKSRIPVQAAHLGSQAVSSAPAAPIQAWKGRQVHVNPETQKLDDTENVWMRAMEKNLSAKNKAKMDNKGAALDADDWEAELAGIEGKAKVKTKQKDSRTRSKIRQIEQFPEAWSRFPSHDRNERILSAGRLDKVEVHDFAVKKADDRTGTIEYNHSPKKHRFNYHDGMSPDATNSHLFRDAQAGPSSGGRLSKLLPSSWTSFGNSLLAREHDAVEGARHQAELIDLAIHVPHVQIGRRGSVAIEERAEFPELEILPLGLPPPASETIDEWADDPEAEKKRVEELKKNKVRVVYAAREPDNKGGGISDLLDIFASGPDDGPPEPPAKKGKGKAKDPFAILDDDDVGGGGGGGAPDEMAKRMGKKKRRKVKDPYDLDLSDLDGSSDMNDGTPSRALSPVPIIRLQSSGSRDVQPVPVASSRSSAEIESKIRIDEARALTAMAGYEYEGAELTRATIADPNFYAECIAIPTAPVTVAEAATTTRHASFANTETSIQSFERGSVASIDPDKTSASIGKAMTRRGKDLDRAMGSPAATSGKRDLSVESTGSRRTVVSRSSVQDEVERLEDLAKEPGVESFPMLVGRGRRRTTGD